MMKIKVSADCGNSPKNLLLKDFSLAFARGDPGFILSRVSDDIIWTRVGDRELRGRDELTSELDKIPLDRVKEIEISHVISHGKAGAVDGRITLMDGGLLFCCGIFEFSSAKGDRISHITSYVIKKDP